MDATQQIGVGLLGVWALMKFWPQIKEGFAKVLPSKNQDEAVTALEAAQTLHAFLSKRPGCKKSLEALGTLTLGNFLPAPQSPPPPAAPEGGEQKIAMEVRHYNLNVPIGKTPLEAAVSAAPVVANLGPTPVVVPVPPAPQAPAGQS